MPSAILIFGTLLGVDALFAFIILLAGWQNLWWTGGLLLLFLALTVYVAKPAFHTVANKTLKIDDLGVRWIISGKVQWDLKWDEIKSAHSIYEHVPDDIPMRGFGLKSKTGEEYNIGDLPDLSPTDQLEEAFNVIGDELVRRGIPVEDAAGWAGATILADKVRRGEMSPDPNIEGRWLKTGVDVKPVVGILVLGIVLAMFSPMFGAMVRREPAAVLFNAAFIAFSMTTMGMIWYLLVRRNISGMLFDDKKVVLRVGHFIKREHSFDWSEVEHITAGPPGEPAIIRLKCGSLHKAVFPQKVMLAFLARFGSYSKGRDQGRKAPKAANSVERGTKIQYPIE